MLGWIPFLEPMNALQPYWYLLLIPFSFGISLIYKAMRLDCLDHLWREVAVMTVQIVLAMMGLALLLALLVELVIPALPVGTS